MNNLNPKSNISVLRRVFGCLLASVLLQMAALAAESDPSTSPLETTNSPATATAEIQRQPENMELSGQPPRIALLIPILGIVGGLSIPILAIWGEYRKRRDLIEAYHKERLLALEKGMEPPAYPTNILEDDESATPPVPGKHLKSGLLWLAIGAGLTIFLYFQPKIFVHFSVGAIPIAIGISQLIYHVVGASKSDSDS